MTCCASYWEKRAERGRATLRGGVPSARWAVGAARLSAGGDPPVDLSLHRAPAGRYGPGRPAPAAGRPDPRYGYRRIWALLNRTQRVNQKRVRRLWRLKRLQVRRIVRPRLRRPRPAQLQAAFPGHIWAYDFLEDAPADGRRIHILTVMDEFTREGLAVDVALTTSADRVIGVLTALVAQHGAPAYLRSDNGAEFTATAVQAWLAECGVETLYIEPGYPLGEALAEREGGTF